MTRLFWYKFKDFKPNSQKKIHIFLTLFFNLFLIYFKKLIKIIYDFCIFIFLFTTYNSIMYNLVND
jgi:hypothetical protein